MAIYLQAAIYERQQQADGSIPCAYCWENLTADTRTLDHVDNDPNNNNPDNIVAACRDCNTLVGRHLSRGYELLTFRLRGLGVDPKKSARSVQNILRAPIRDRRDPAVVLLAEQWFGDRLEYQRQIAAERRDRTGSKAPRKRAINMDEEIPF